MELAKIIRSLFMGIGVAFSIVAGAGHAEGASGATQAAEDRDAKAPVETPSQDLAEVDGESTIVVRGRTEPPARGEVYEQARELSRVGRFQLYEEALPRFWAPLCPGVAGLKVEAAERMVDRIRDNAKRVGIRLAKADCSPNLVVAFVENGQSLLSNLQRHRPDIFSLVAADEQAELLSEQDPVRVWSNMAWRWTGGSAPPARWPKERASVWGQHNRAAMPEARDIVSALVVFDQSAVMEMTVTQLADYATMRGLTHTRPAKGGEALETILALFASDAQAPAEMTSFDIGYLRSLYESAPNASAANRLLAVRGQIRVEETKLSVPKERSSVP